MKTPPFLLGATLLFWGWQTGLLAVAVPLAVVLESARWVRVRWEFSSVDFNRIWTFCALLFLAAAVYAFTANDGPAAFGSYFRNPTVNGSTHAGTVASRAAATWVQWQPMLFYLFLLAQSFNCREGVPVETVSLLLRLRWQRTRLPGQPETSGRTVNISYAYFGLCLFAASAHGSNSRGFFWGLALLLGWALWPLASPRFSRPFWAATLVMAILLGYGGQLGLSQLQRYVEGFNPQWFSRFSRQSTDPLQSRTALGDIGRLQLSGRIIIRLETEAGQAPGYLREASYRSYRTQVWHSDVSTNEFIPVNPGTNGTTYLLLPGKTNTAAVNIACYLPGGSGLLPLPSGCASLEQLGVIELEKSPMGAVLALGPGLVIFDAHYGPGATIDSLPEEASPKRDLDVPAREAPALDRVLAEVRLGGQSEEQKLAGLKAFFDSKFTYSTWQKRARWGGSTETPLSRFLLHTRSGHCEYFATAGVLLLRRLHIPARYAVGYAVHEGKDGHYVVRERDAHAWCLVWNGAARRWEDFDPTPASWVEEEAQRASAWQALLDGWSWLSFQFAKLRWGQTHLREYVLWALLPLLALLLYRIVFGSQRRRFRLGRPGAEAPPDWPGSDSEFYQLEAKLVARGLARQPAEALSHWLARAAAAPALASLHPSLQALLRLHYRLRFDPTGLEPSEREALRRETALCLQRLELL